MSRRVIYKYPVEVTPSKHLITITVPNGAIARSMDWQGHGFIPQLYAEVDPDTEILSELTVWVAMTGQPFPEGNFRFLNTISIDDGRFVVHCYVREEG